MRLDLFRQDARDSSARYQAIGDYAVIGDCHGAALVSLDGGVDWLCLGRMDNDPLLCRILDSEKGGYFSIRPSGRFSVERGYLNGTNILKTIFTTDSGRIAITDFMPVGRRPGAGVHDYVRLVAPGWLVRMIDGLEGEVEVRLDYRPTPDFARRPARLSPEKGHIVAEGGPLLYHELPTVKTYQDSARGTAVLRAGDARRLVLTARPPTTSAPLESVDELLRLTRAFWEEWIAYCRYQGPYREAVLRSALVLKLMTYAPSGAIVAAPTTSLPEEIGGVRNWDYRYCWLRDSTFTLYALAVLGYGGEARCFSDFLRRACAASSPQLQIMYGVEAETDLSERVLDHLEGYRGSAPVRTGNGAFSQCQMDVYGEVLDWACLFGALGGRFDREARGMLEGLAEFATTHWHGPDQGLWEMRGPPRHHVHGKIMSWVALDRAIRLLGPRPHWEAERDSIAKEVLARGLDPSKKLLRQAYDQDGVDAALLLLPMVGFPVDRAVLEATVAAVEQELRRGDVVYRYRGEDGVEGGEGAFLMCSFWLVDALLHLQRHGEAKALFERLLARANDVGLLPEEIDPETGAFLGNFPQAFTHLALIGAAFHLGLYEKRGPKAIIGTHADRARRELAATLGWRAIWAAFKATRRVGRIVSSKRSILRPELIE